MTTIAQVKQVAQPLLQRNQDVALVGRLLVVKPIHHILRGVHVGRSLHPGLFVPTWATILLFEPSDGLSYNWGERVYDPTGNAWDITSHDNMPTTLCEAVEEQALPLLRPLKDIDDFVEFVTKERFPYTHFRLYEHRKIFVDIARGDLDAARSICDYMNTENARRRYLSLKMDEEYDRITKELCPLIAKNDRTGLARLLHKYEEGSVRAMKLEKYWEPTPFPIEINS